MMASIPMSFQCITLKLIKLSIWLPRLGLGLWCQKSTLNQRTLMLQCTCRPFSIRDEMAWPVLCGLSLVADMVVWILVNQPNVADLLHYVDDFTTTSEFRSVGQESTHLPDGLPEPWPSPSSRQVCWPFH